MSIAYLSIMRPHNCLMTAISVFVGALIVFPSFDLFSSGAIWLAMVAAFLISGAGNAINDYVDIEADKINAPRRPIPSGRISKDKALWFSIILFLVGIVLAGMVNWVIFLIAVFNSLLLVIYSTHLQNKLFMGNISISYLVASGFLFGGAALSNIAIPAMLALLAGLANMAREVVKDLEDMEGDRFSFLKRIAKKTVHAIVPSIAERFGIDGKTAKPKYNARTLSAIVVVFLLLAIIASPLPFIFGLFGLGYLVILFFADIAFLSAAVIAVKASKKKHYHKASKMIKLGMFLGLVAFIVGALV